MAEQKFVKDTPYGMKNDFLGEGEIAVTITLHEYRELVASYANKEREIEEVRKSLFKEIETLRAEKKVLESKLEKYGEEAD